MKFATVQEAFNYYNSKDIEEIEKRAAEIGKLIDGNENADIQSLNIELDGLKQAKENIIEKRSKSNKGFNPVTGMEFNKGVDIPEGTDLFKTKEYRSAFFKEMLGQKLTEAEKNIYERARMEKRADTFNAMSNSAAVLPTQTLNEIIEKARTQGGLISAVRQFNIPSNLSVPIGTPGTKANWHVEGVAVESEKVDTVSVSFSAYEILKVFSMSAIANKMSIGAFESYLETELTNCVMDTLNEAMVSGTGSGQGTGLITGITWDATNSFTYADKPAYTDFTKMLGMLKRGYGANAKFAMNNASLYNLVYSLVDNNDRPLFIADAQQQQIGYILGKPIIIDDYIPDDTILLGDFNYMGYNLPQGVLLEVSRESSFKSGLIDYRALAIADCKPLVPEAFLKLSKTVTP
ncbi:phage major capsid protein [Clostridium sp. HV4-5-A1G]|uniref:phage major capsid protein n=1 Tax=Clostridium sp. HV4-5-A1G TaxID=2004595 RepID=UPI00123923CE|nr:phage major capsid protein [Clostridium sp. HV4-5-A1G]KAA8674459.1 phage major capsid protein [Clostridium sp. HV4-5-A1G]